MSEPSADSIHRSPHGKNGSIFLGSGFGTFNSLKIILGFFFDAVASAAWKYNITLSFATHWHRSVAVDMKNQRGTTIRCVHSTKYSIGR